MHLLLETALGDSMPYSVLPFDEVEDLKRALAAAVGRTDGLRRKLAMEMKVQEAAQSLGRLGSNPSSRGSSPDIYSRFDGPDAELASSTRKCEELALELWRNETAVAEMRTRLLEHTAGVLQMTHKGLKDDSSAPSHSEESFNARDLFDDRSLYRPLDNVDFSARSKASADSEAIQEAGKNLEAMNSRVREILVQSGTPESSLETANGIPQEPLQKFQSQLVQLEQGLNAITAHPRDAPVEVPTEPPPETHASPPSEDLAQACETMANLNRHIINDILQGAVTPSLLHPLPTNIFGLLNVLSIICGDLGRRIEDLVDQKSILTTQIQQQRTLNEKSDAQRDSHIAALTEKVMSLEKEVDISHRQHNAAKEDLAIMLAHLQEAQANVSSQPQPAQSGLSEEDRAAYDATLAEHVAARNQIEQARAAECAAYESTLADHVASRDAAEQGRAAAEATLGDHITSLQQAEAARSRIQSEFDELEANFIHMQTEFTMARAELDGAQGNRTERGRAEGEMQQELEEMRHQLEQLQTKNIEFASELAMTRAGAEQQVTNTGDAARAAEMQTDLDQLRTRNMELTMELAELRELRSKYSEISSNMGELEQLRTKNVELSSDLAEVEQLRTKNMELTLELAELDQLRTKNVELASEFAEFEHLRTRYSELLDTKTSQEREIEQLHAKNMEFASELATLRAEQMNSSNDSSHAAEELRKRVTVLERELRDTIDDYEVLTKASVEFEKEREMLERAVDDFRDRADRLETQLEDERVKGLGSGSESVSTAVLKSEFKKMLRDARSENLKILKVSLVLGVNGFVNHSPSRRSKRSDASWEHWCDRLGRSVCRPSRAFRPRHLRCRQAPCIYIYGLIGIMCLWICGYSFLGTVLLHFISSCIYEECSHVHNSRSGLWRFCVLSIYEG